MIVSTTPIVVKNTPNPVSSAANDKKPEIKLPKAIDAVNTANMIISSLSQLLPVYLRGIFADDA